MTWEWDLPEPDGTRTTAFLVTQSDYDVCSHETVFFDEQSAYEYVGMLRRLGYDKYLHVDYEPISLYLPEVTT